MTNAMDEGYSPKSVFLCMMGDDIPLTGSDLADHNLRLLIGLTRDSDVSNRDWATFLLAQREIDTPEVRQALLAAAEDSIADVRAEALAGLAARDKELARPLVERELDKEECGYGAFEAALLIAHPSLLCGLKKWEGVTEQSWFDKLVQEAIAACETPPRSGS